MPGAADHPGRLVGEAADHEGMFGLGQNQRRVQLIKRDPGSTGRGDRGLAFGKVSPVVGQDADMAGRRLDRFIEPQTQPVAGEHDDAGAVGGVDHVQPEPERLGEEPKVGAQVGRGQQDLGTNFGHGSSRRLAVFPVWGENYQAFPAAAALVCHWRRDRHRVDCLTLN